MSTLINSPGLQIRDGRADFIRRGCLKRLKNLTSAVKMAFGTIVIILFFTLKNGWLCC